MSNTTQTSDQSTAPGAEDPPKKYSARELLELYRQGKLPEEYKGIAENQLIWAAQNEKFHEENPDAKERGVYLK